MPRYATADDIAAIYGADKLTLIADRDFDGTPDAPAVDAVLDTVSAIIDGYLAVRYKTPIHPVPEILRQIAVDMAVYSLAQSADVRTDEDRKRSEDAEARLKRLSRGEMRLPGQGSDDDDGTDLDGPNPTVVAGPPRLFSREKMRGL